MFKKKLVNVPAISCSSTVTFSLTKIIAKVPIYPLVKPSPDTKQKDQPSLSKIQKPLTQAIIRGKKMNRSTTGIQILSFVIPQRKRTRSRPIQSHNENIVNKIKGNQPVSLRLVKLKLLISVTKGGQSASVVTKRRLITISLNHIFFRTSKRFFFLCLYAYRLCHILMKAFVSPGYC